MASHIVYVDVPRAQRQTSADHGEPRGLFGGQKLWFAHAIPQRHWLIENARLNGATIVDLDKQADIKLVDHARKNQAPGTHSYRYVELSIRNSKLEDLAAHAVGASTRVSRPVGSTVTAPRSGRVPYTEADDQFLWNWMKPFEERGGAYKGNEVYKQIEQENPRHTFQSWRDRWLKNTRYQKRSITNSDATEPHHIDGPDQEPDQDEIAHELPVLEPEQDQPRRSVSLGKKKKRLIAGNETEAASEVEPQHKSKRPRQPTPGMFVEPATIEPSTERSLGERPVERSEPEVQGREPENEDTESITESENRFLQGITGPFSMDDSLELYRLAPVLTAMTPGQFLRVWRDMASSEDFKHHSAQEWKHWFEYRVLPDYCREKGLRIEEVAPYLFMQQDDGTPDEKLSSDNDDPQHEDRPAETLEQPITCSNCYASEAEEWHHDKKGRSLCQPCAVFLRTHGVPRPSTMGLNALGEAEDSEPQRPQTPSRLLSPQKIAITPIVSSIKVSPKLASADVYPAARNESEVPRGQRETRSPSFQPESPTLSRPPEPNEARKRSAGRVTQSQSTQGTNQSSIESQAQNSSHSLGLVMGEAQSKEAQPPPEEHQDTGDLELNTAAPPFSFATAGARHRQRLRDDPRNLDIQQDSSLSTDRGPPREPPSIHLSTESDGLGSSPHFAPSLSHPQGSLPPEPEGFSPLFVAQDDQPDFKELELQDTEQQDIGPPDDEQLTSPLRLNLMSEGQWEVPGPDASSRSSSYQSDEVDTKPPIARIRGGSSGTSAYDSDEEDQEEADPRAPISRVRETSIELGSQSFETSRDTMDQWETAPEQPRKRNRAQDRLSTQALFDDPDIDVDTSTYLEIPEPEGGWDTILGSEAADTFEDNHRPAAPSKKSLHKKQAAGAAQDVQPDIHVHQENRVPSPHADEENIDYNDPERGEWVMDKWEKLEKARYPNIRNMEPILYKAAYCTSCEFSRASELVDRFLEQLRRKRRRTSSTSTSKLDYAGVSEAELVVPEDMPGVWTDEDDRLLFSTNPDDVRRIFDKHGHRAYDRRIEFLEAQQPE
ncbi:hypothetical protein LTR72_002956 [Exophiala xenobiotica]|nr:hypothetical protein LTR72_002956 [Exophiala xenobiotica]KAK5300716.1 hypothetical protein LTR14_001114 [Exophiala xenobiotica]KAK5489853.1 hypothetical protein LTR55_004372 [Exophiala xenobiotica]